jgi:catechol 2,3-dioxygenase-like lactoylglutathione lyase family enzyme
MIQGLFETHIEVTNLEKAIAFYKNTLGLEMCRTQDERRLAFFWLGKPKQQMLGLWEKTEGEIAKRHFAFTCDPQWILNESINFLKSKNLPFRNFLNDGTERPMVFAWMPAISIYFDDPDGNYIEFIGVLDGKPRPEKGIISYDEYLELEKQ